MVGKGQNLGTYATSECVGWRGWNAAPASGGRQRSCNTPQHVLPPKGSSSKCCQGQARSGHLYRPAPEPAPQDPPGAGRTQAPGRLGEGQAVQGCWQRQSELGGPNRRRSLPPCCCRCCRR